MRRATAALRQDLKSVADAQHQAARGRELLDRLHNGREVSDGAGAKIIPIGEAAGHQDRIAVLKLLELSCHRKSTGSPTTSEMTW